jgi:hypothetical protein
MSKKCALELESDLILGGQPIWTSIQAKVEKQVPVLSDEMP